MDGGFLPHLRRDDPKPPHISTVSVSVSLSSCKPLSSKKTMPRTHGIRLSPSQHKTCFRSRYGSAPTSWSACTLLHSCQSLLRPKPSRLPTSPQFVKPRDCSRAPCCTSKFPGTVHPHLRGTLHSNSFPFLPSLTVPASPYAHAAEKLHHLPNPCLAPDSYSSFLIPHSSTHKSLASHATTKSKQIKSNQKSPRDRSSLRSVPTSAIPQSSHNLISVVWTLPRPPFAAKLSLIFLVVKGTLIIMAGAHARFLVK